MPKSSKKKKAARPKPRAAARKKAAPKKRGKARRRMSGKQIIKDLLLNQPKKGEAKAAARAEKSNIFPGEMSSRMKDLSRKTGIDNFGETFSRLSVANPDSRFAMPARGDYDIKTATSVQATKIRASMGDEKMGVEASLTIKAANVLTLQPFFHTPGNAQDAYNLPKSYVEQIRWSRLMFNLNPYIASVTELKAYYPVSKFKLSTSEPFVTEFYEEVSFNKRFNLYSFMQRMNLSLKKFGEAVVWGTRKQDGVWPQTGQPRWVWSNFIILEPELLEIKKEVIGDSNPRYFLRPNRDFEELVRRLEQNDPSVAHLQGTIAPTIVTKIKNRELIPLDPTTISSIQNLTDGSAERGTPPYQRLFVNFTFEDFVRLALMAQAQRYHFPVELWTIGNLEKNIIPTVKDLEAFRDMVASAIQAPPFSMFFPPIVDYKALGVNGTLMDIKADMEYAHKQYLIGLGVNENMILGESGIFSSNETAGNQTFIRLVQRDRDNLEEWARWNFFEPLAQWNNLKIEKNGRLLPIIPNLEWEKTLDFKAAEDEREMLKWAYEKKIVDPETIIEALLNRNPEEIKIRIRKAIGGVLDDGKLGGAARKAIESGGEAAADKGGGGAALENNDESPKGGGGGGGGAGPSLAPKVGAPEEAPGLAPKVGEAAAPEKPEAGGPPAGAGAVPAGEEAAKP